MLGNDRNTIKTCEQCNCLFYGYNNRDYICYVCKNEAGMLDDERLQSLINDAKTPDDLENFQNELNQSMIDFNAAEQERFYQEQQWVEDREEFERRERIERIERAERLSREIDFVSDVFESYNTGDAMKTVIDACKCLGNAAKKAFCCCRGERDEYEELP